MNSFIDQTKLATNMYQVYFLMTRTFNFATAFHQSISVTYFAKNTCNPAVTYASFSNSINFAVWLQCSSHKSFNMINIFSIVIYTTILWIAFNVFNAYIYFGTLNNTDCFESIIISIIISSFCMYSPTQHITVIINRVSYCQSNYEHRITLYIVTLLLLIVIMLVICKFDSIACNLSNFITVTLLQQTPSQSTYYVSPQQQQRLPNGFSFVFSSFFPHFLIHSDWQVFQQSHIFLHLFKRQQKFKVVAVSALSKVHCDAIKRYVLPIVCFECVCFLIVSTYKYHKILNKILFDVL